MKPRPVQRQQLALQEILHEFSLAKEKPDAALLNDFLERYPQHAAALREFAVHTALDAAEPAIPSEIDARWPSAQETSHSVSSALLRFDEQLRARRAEMEAQTHSESSAIPAINPFAHLDRKALQVFRSQLNASTLFVTRLRDRLIDAQTISEGFIRHVADLLQTAPETLKAHFAAVAQVPLRANYKAEQKPEAAGKQSFADAVRASNLTKEQQEHLLGL